MGRLTKYGEDGWMKLSKQKDEYGNEIKVAIDGALRKLAHYEDLEEAGRLIELPCAVGDTVYAIGGVRWAGYDWKWKVYDEAYIEEIKFNLDMFGGSYFLTKEEAERELKRLKLITDPNVGSAS